LLCPSCREPIDPARLACARGHAFEHAGGVLSLVDARFARELAAFEARLAASRRALGRQLLDRAAYERLPSGQEAAGDAAWRAEWRMRGCDLAVVERLLAGRGRLSVLDVGAWNGWLSNRLACLGHSVTAVDYFTGEHDGLGAVRHYARRWRAVQLDLRDLSLLDEAFDAVIFNRCLPFFPDPLAGLAGAMRLLSPGGQLIVTGLQIFTASRERARQVEAGWRAHRERFGFDLLLFPSKAYFDGGDARNLRRWGLRLRGYPQLRLANVRATLDPRRPRQMFGVRHA
jgi:SAM-dependent methyltransferase